MSDVNILSAFNTLFIAIDVEKISLRRPSPPQHRRKSLENNLQIQPQRPVFDIFRIQLHHFLKIRDVAPSADLPKPCQTWHRSQTALVMEVVLLVFINGRWACPNQCHIALQNVDALRELVDAGFPEEAADRHDAGIVVDLEHQAVHLVLGHQILFAFLGVYVHGAEFVELEAAAIHADALLAEEDRAGRLDVDDRREEHVCEAGGQEAGEAGGEADQPLDEEFSGSDDAEAGGDAGEAVHFFDLGVGEFAGDAVDVDVDRDSHFEELVGDLVGMGVVGVEHNLVNDVGEGVFEHVFAGGDDGDALDVGACTVDVQEDDALELQVAVFVAQYFFDAGLDQGFLRDQE